MAVGSFRFDALARPAGTLRVDGRVVARRVAVADRPLSRLVGMLGTPDPGHDEALVITRCNWVHGVMLRARIGVAFVDCHGTVLRVVDPLPARGARCRGAVAVIEAASGVLHVRPGQQVRVDGTGVFPHDGHFASRGGGSIRARGALSGHRGHTAPIDDRRT